MGRTNDAYDELAAVLVSAERSPCRDGGVISPTEIIERALSHVAGQNVTIALPLQPLVKEILSGLSRASNAEIEDAYGSALLQLLPNLEPYLDSTEIPPEQVYSAIVRIDEWLEARRPINRFSRKARLHLFDPRVRAQADYLAVDQWSAGLTRPPRRALMPISWTLIAVGGSLRRVKLGLFHRYLDRRPRLSRWVQGSVLLRLAKKIDANRKVRRSYWRHRTAYISELSRAMAGFEQENSWSELFGPAQDIGSRRL